MSYVKPAINTLSFLITTVSVFFLTLTVTDDFLPLTRTMHAYEQHVRGGTLSTVTAPSRYAALDWILHPLNNAVTGEAYKPISVQADLCEQWSIVNADNDVKNCAPQFWQTSEFCPTPKEALTTWKGRILDGDGTALTGTSLTDAIKPIYNHETKNFGVYDCDGTNVCYAQSTAFDACRMERVGEYSLVPNDYTSWSLASGHSSDLLYLGAALTLWLVNIFHLTPYIFKNKQNAQQALNRAFAFIAFIFIILLRTMPFFVSSTWKDTTSLKVYAHLLPNGSYFYVLISIFWVSLMAMREDVFCRIARAAGLDPTSVVPAAIQGDVPMSALDPNQDPTDVPEAILAGRINLKSFSKGRNLEAYLPKQAPGVRINPGDDDEKRMAYARVDNYAPQVVLEPGNFQYLAQNPADLTQCSCKFEITQLFVLPLLVLASATRYTAWEIDGKLEILYLGAVGYALLDVFRNRLHMSSTIFNTVFMMFDEKKPMDPKNVALVSASNAVAQKLEYMSQPVHAVISIIELLCIFIQTNIFIVLFFAKDWASSLWFRRSVLLLKADEGKEEHMDFSTWTFTLYVFLSLIFKLVCIFASRKTPSDEKGSKLKKLFCSKNLLFTLLVVLTAAQLFNAIVLRESNPIADAGNRHINEKSTQGMFTGAKRYTELGKWQGTWVEL